MRVFLRVGQDATLLLKIICYQALGKVPEVLNPTEVTVKSLYSCNDETLAASYGVWFPKLCHLLFWLDRLVNPCVVIHHL